MNASATLAGRRVLLVEDEYFIAMEMADTFEHAGAEVVGPAASVQQALELLATTERLDGAVLDMNLGGEMALPVADALNARGIPFVFATGYDRSAIPDRFAQVHCEKPVDPQKVASLLFS